VNGASPRRRPTLAARARAIAIGALLAPLSGCSLVLDFGALDDDAGPPDAGRTDATPGACGAFEPNDTLSQAASTPAGYYPAIAICPGGDRDFFGLVSHGSQDIIIRIEFDNQGGAGDLELALYAANGNSIARSTTSGGAEEIARTLATANRLEAGDYAAEVFGFNGTIENEYNLTISITTPGVDDAGP
jgi:hypothetical protein